MKESMMSFGHRMRHRQQYVRLAESQVNLKLTANKFSDPKLNIKHRQMECKVQFSMSNQNYQVRKNVPIPMNNLNLLLQPETIFNSRLIQNKRNGTIHFYESTALV